MAGVVLQNISSRKLLGLSAGFLVLLAAFFLIGATIAPTPSNVQQILGTKCILPRGKTFWDTWSIPRGEGQCAKVNDFKDPKINEKNVTSDRIVFSFWAPGPKSGSQLAMSPWFLSMVSVLLLDMKYNDSLPHENSHMKLDLKLGYRNYGDNVTIWKSLAQSSESRELECTIQENRRTAGAMYKCTMLWLFELGSCDYDYYLLNLRLPSNRDTNVGIGRLDDVWLVLIHQNGRFTKVWLSMKTTVFPVVLVALILYWWRIRHLNRSPTLLEKTLFALGLATTFLNFPVEWLAILTTTPFMLLYIDIRQGIFYAMLLAFWLIFVGEHSKESNQRTTLATYSIHVRAVFVGCIAWLVFGVCERVFQLKNPFSSIWVTEVGRKVAFTFIIAAGICACLYFLFLSYMIIRVFRNISAKKTALPRGVFYRFKFLMIITMLCAASTVIFFIISQVKGQHRWGDDPTLEYTSGLFTGVYGMWNVYVFALLVLYAPSYKETTEQDSEGLPEQDEASPINSQ